MKDFSRTSQEIRLIKHADAIAAPHHRQRVASVVLLAVLLAGLITYKTGPALRNIHVAQKIGTLTLRPYLAQPVSQSRLLLAGKESFAYLRIIGPALVFGIFIAAAARIAISPGWFARVAGTAGWRGAISGAVAGAPLMLCSCCAAPVFEGLYERTRRLDASLALMLAAPSLNPAALILTFMLFPMSIAAGRVAMTLIALAGIAVLGAKVSAAPLPPLREEELASKPRPLLVSYAAAVVHVTVRTVPLILAGIVIGIFIFNHVPGSAVLLPSSSPILAALVIGAALLLPVPTLFEIPLAYGLFVAGIPAGIIAAILFVGPVVNLPSLLVVGRTAGAKVATTLGLFLWMLAVAIGFSIPR